MPGKRSSDLAAYRTAVVNHCSYCGKEIKQPYGRGRIAFYCSNACRQHAYRIRKGNRDAKA